MSTTTRRLSHVPANEESIHGAGTEQPELEAGVWRWESGAVPRYRGAVCERVVARGGAGEGEVGLAAGGAGGVRLRGGAGWVLDRPVVEEAGLQEPGDGSGQHRSAAPIADEEDRPIGRGEAPATAPAC